MFSREVWKLENSDLRWIFFINNEFDFVIIVVIGFNFKNHVVNAYLGYAKCYVAHSKYFSKIALTTKI